MGNRRSLTSMSVGTRQRHILKGLKSKAANLSNSLTKGVFNEQKTLTISTVVLSISSAVHCDV